jgi:hypothetical protein
VRIAEVDVRGEEEEMVAATIQWRWILAEAREEGEAAEEEEEATIQWQWIIAAWARVREEGEGVEAVEVVM